MRRDVWFAVDDRVEHAVALVRTVQATLFAQHPVIIIQVSHDLSGEPLHRTTSARKRDIVDVSGEGKFVATGDPTNTLIDRIENDVADRHACGSALGQDVPKSHEISDEFRRVWSNFQAEKRAPYAVRRDARKEVLDISMKQMRMTLMPLQGPYHTAPSPMTQAIEDREEIEEFLEEIDVTP